MGTDFFMFFLLWNDGRSGLWRGYETLPNAVVGDYFIVDAVPGRASH